MSLSREIVRRELEAVGTFYFVPTLHGFEIPRLAAADTWRLVHGGGISGDGDRVWWFERKSGPDKSRVVRTRAELRRIIIERLAGERPPEREGYTLYARRHSTRFTDSVLWFYRRRRTP